MDWKEEVSNILFEAGCAILSRSFALEDEDLCSADEIAAMQEAGHALMDEADAMLAEAAEAA
jgi:hypothetical protein